MMEDLIKHTPGHTAQLFFFNKMRRKFTMRIIWFSDLRVKCTFLLLVAEVALLTRLCRRYLSQRPRQKVSVSFKTFNIEYVMCHFLSSPVRVFVLLYAFCFVEIFIRWSFHLEMKSNNQRQCFFSAVTM